MSASVAIPVSPAGAPDAPHLAPAQKTIALVGPPNAGKSTLFNGLTGGRAKIGNYAGVTVELKSGTLDLGGHPATLIDLPGITGFTPRSPDAKVTLDVIEGRSPDVPRPDLLIAVVDAAQLRRYLPFLLALTALRHPMIVALNMFDLATRDGVAIDIAALEAALGVPVVPTTATREAGRTRLRAMMEDGGRRAAIDLDTSRAAAQALSSVVLTAEPGLNSVTKRIDQIVLHPVAGSLILITLLFFVFQAVFAWAEAPMTWIEDGILGLGRILTAAMPDNWFRSLLVDGIFAGVGSVVVFLPQIVILFTFILLLELSGYMARAAFLVDELMMRAGLNGRAFIPLLSSFACAIPGMMAARTLENDRDRLTTVLIAPLMTCSARLPVYTVLIGAFIPAQHVGPLNLQGLVMFGLYVAGIVSAVIIAYVLRRTLTRGTTQSLLMELPTYKAPSVRELLLGLWLRVKIFLRRAGTIIFTVSIVLWAMVSFPAGPLPQTLAGRLGSLLEPIFAPIGFNLEMVIALVPGLAAREVAVGALGTVYAVQNAEENLQGLGAILANEWSFASALAFIAWYVFAPQCISTLAVARRETNSWGWTAFMAGYLFALAYIAAGATYWLTRALGG